MMAAAFRPAVFHPWGLSGDVRRPLGQTPPPRITADRLSEIRKAVDAALDALRLDVEAVGVEADWTSPDALRVEPEKYRMIGGVGGFSPYEIRMVVITDGSELGNLASRIRKGPLSHYLTPEQAAAADDAASGAAKVVRYVQGLDREDIKPDHMQAAEEHVQSHLRNVKPLVETAERMLVEGEAPFVQVREPGEKGVTPLQIAVGAGAVAVAGFLLWQLLG